MPDEATQDQSVNVSREMVERYKELHSIMKEFRQTLGPRKEAIFEGVMTGIDMDEVFDLIEVSGGESLTVSGEYEGKNISIMFRTKA